MGAIVIAAGYILSSQSIHFLWLSSLGFIINWYGDSLDGTLARVRDMQRPIYGYYLDHTVDCINEAFMFLGVGLSPLMNLPLALMILVVYLFLTINVSVNAHLKGEFKLTYLKLGPTEFRVFAILVNTLFILVRPLRDFSQQVNILKTSQDGTTPLSGAVFSLYTESGYNAKPKQASKTELISDGNGKIDLGKLAYGKYYLVETTAPAGYVLLSEPVVIIVGSSGVTYTQGDRNLPLSGNGINHNTTTDIYTLTVTNNAGARLPSTGGSGTAPYTLAGIALMGIALFLLLRRRAGCGE